ncbi:hypothetical protein ACPEIC_29195 [Stenotrophomonas sp. NPDC087984]
MTEDRNGGGQTYQGDITVWRSPLRAIEDRNVIIEISRYQGGVVAVTLRDDRGSQRRAWAPAVMGRVAWRSAFGATEGRNGQTVVREVRGETEWRSRRPRATDDRNCKDGSYRRVVIDVAVAFRGDRGSQPRGERRGLDLVPGGGRPPAATEDRNIAQSTSGDQYDQVAVALRRRPRIATPSTGRGPTASREWRSPSGAAEDRNGLSTPNPVDAETVAVALRGG